MKENRKEINLTGWESRSKVTNIQKWHKLDSLEANQSSTVKQTSTLASIRSVLHSNKKEREKEREKEACMDNLFYGPPFFDEYTYNGPDRFQSQSEWMWIFYCSLPFSWVINNACYPIFVGNIGSGRHLSPVKAKYLGPKVRGLWVYARTSPLPERSIPKRWP